MQYNSPSYYRPYTPDGSIGSGSSETSGDGSDGSDDKSDVGGPGFTTEQSQLEFQHRTASGFPFESDKSEQTLANPMKITTTYQTSLLSVRSADRNKLIYPTSHYLTLNTPRIYKDVSQLQCVQITYPNFINYIMNLNIYDSAISSFIGQPFTGSNPAFISCLEYINPAIASNSFGISEYAKNPNTPQQSCYIKHVVTVPPGIYDPFQIVSELNKQMNKTPPFNIISYSDFRNKFLATKDVSCLFNEGGAYLYNTLSRSFRANPTRDDILVNYFPLTHKKYGTIPTEQEIFIAYYYPVLKETLIDTKDRRYLNYATYSEDQVMSSVVFSFQGISSQIYFDLCSSNTFYLNKLRQKYTFTYNLLNQYDWYYNNIADRIGLRVSYLNLSIRNEMNKQRQFWLCQALSGSGLTASQYNGLDLQSMYTGAVMTDLADRLNTMYATTMGIPYGVYSISTLGVVSSLVSTMNPIGLPVEQTTANDDYLINLAKGNITVAPCVTSMPGNFGCISQVDLISDVNASATFTYPSAPFYYSSLSSLNSSSIINSVIFGDGYVCDFAGTSITTSGFSTFHSTFRNYVSVQLTQLSVLSTVIANTNTKLAQYMYDKYGSIFPNSYFSPSTFLSGMPMPTGPVLLDMKTPIIYQTGSFTTYGTTANECKSAINAIMSNVLTFMPANYPNTLPFKMGFNCAEEVVIGSTLAYSCPFPNHNVYLQLNVNRPFNKMDVLAESERSVVSAETISNYVSAVSFSTIVTSPVSTIAYNSNAPLGETNVVLGKILLSGQKCTRVSQTMIQNPVHFKPFLGKLDRLEFRLLLDDNLIPLDTLIPYNIPCMEWDAVFQIDEQVSVLDSGII